MNKNIDKQVKENPLTKEESRVHFNEINELLNIKHSFNFDEAWEIGEEIRKRKDFREKISELEVQISSLDTTTAESIQKANPVKHSLAGGCYIREIYNPANEIIITKIHKKEHPFFLMKGEMSILTEEGIQHIKAPYQGITKPGTKRVIYTHKECTFITVHATENTTIKDIEEEVICTKYEDLLPGDDILDVLKKINLKEE